MRIERAKYPICMMENCNKLADYEFTDYTSEKLTYTIASTCDEHFEKMRALVGKAQEVALNYQDKGKTA